MGLDEMLLRTFSMLALDEAFELHTSDDFVTFRNKLANVHKLIFLLNRLNFSHITVSIVSIVNNSRLACSGPTHLINEL
jgi:hypothetical protein